MRPTLLALGLVAACGSGAEPPARASTRDSAGVTIVENARPLAADSVAFLVDSAPAVQIGGGADPHEEFGRISGLAHLSGGVIVVADGGSQELRFFDSTGAWTRTSGGKGGGPGEFDMIGAVFPLGPDSLAVYDINHRRVSVFGADGRLGREMTLSQAPDGFPFVLGVLGADLLVRSEQFSQSLQSGSRRDTVPVVRYPRWAAPAVPLGRFPGTEMYVSVQRNLAGMIAYTTNTMLPFGRTLTLAAAGARLYVGTADRYEIFAYDSVGTLIRLMRWTHASVPVTGAEVAAMKRQRLEGFAPGEEPFRDRVKDILEGMTFPSTKPAYDGFAVGDDGALWVRRYDQPAVDLPARYDVFDRDGQWLGHVILPPRFTLHHAGPGYALGVWQDPDEVEQVRLYRLRPTP